MEQNSKRKSGERKMKCKKLIEWTMIKVGKRELQQRFRAFPGAEKIKATYWLLLGIFTGSLTRYGGIWKLERI
jgi:hypothetical protein